MAVTVCRHAGRRGARLQQDSAGQQLGQDAAQGPDVDLLVIGQPKDDLRGTV